MKALVVAPQPFFSPRGTPLSVYYRTLITAELGVQVDLLTYGQGKDVDIPGVQIERIPGFDYLGEVKVGPSLLKLFLDAFVFGKMVRMLASNDYDFVHVHEEAVFFGLILKPIFGFKLVYDMHSSLPQQLRNFEFTQSRILISLFETLEKSALESSEVVITICEDLYHYANQFIPDTDQHWLIENSLVDPVRIVESDREGQNGASDASHSEQVSLPEGRRFIVYTGTLEPYQGIDLQVKAFQRVVAEETDAFLLVAGGTPDQVRRYSRMAEDFGIGEHCLFTGSVPKNTATAFVDRADVLLSTRTTGGNTPLKIYEQLSSGKPIVATDIHSHTQVLNDEVAFLVEPEPDSIARGILDALRLPDERGGKIAAAQSLYQQQYSRDRYTQKMEQVLEALR